VVYGANAPEMGHGGAAAQDHCRALSLAVGLRNGIDCMGKKGANPMKDKCIFCKFVHLNNKQWICYRYPPTVFVTVDKDNNGEVLTQHTFWPKVERDDWCGEFSKKDDGRL
jgi:hypothetical protein